MNENLRAAIRRIIHEYMPPPSDVREQFSIALARATSEGLGGDAAISRAEVLLTDNAELWAYFDRLAAATRFLEQAITSGGVVEAPRPPWPPSDDLDWDQLVTAVAVRVRSAPDATA